MNWKLNWSPLMHDAPQWLRDAKFGLFFHWGVYSVPAFGNEWYSRNMYDQEHREFEHHVKTYGAQKDFGYKDFIPMFRAEKFSASEWIKTFREAGARFVMPTTTETSTPYGMPAISMKTKFATPTKRASRRLKTI